MAIAPIVEASHRSCPCDIDLDSGVDVYYQRKPCLDCQVEVLQEHLEREHAERTAEPSPRLREDSEGLSGIEHSRAEEIRRIHRLSCKRIIP